MPETIKSIKIENNSLKSQIVILQKDFKSFQEGMDKKLAKLPRVCNDKTVNLSDSEAEKSLNFLGNQVDDMSRFREFAEKEFKRLNKRLEGVAKKSDELSDAIDDIQKYSYQYNVKLLGVPECNERETAATSTELCVRLFNGMGVEVKAHDIDIAHRVPHRNASATGPKPIVCKFVRRVVKDEVIRQRKEASKVKSEALGLSSDASLCNVLVMEHLTPKAQNLLAEAKRFSKQHNFKFCWVKNAKIYLRKNEESRHIFINNLSDLEGLNVS